MTANAQNNNQSIVPLLGKLSQSRVEQAEALKQAGNIIAWLIGALMPEERDSDETREYLGNIQVALGNLSVELDKLKNVNGLLAEMVRTLVAMNQDFEILYVKTQKKLNDIQIAYRQNVRNEIISQIALKQGLSVHAVELFIQVMTGEEQVSSFLVNDATRTIREVADEVGYYYYDEDSEDEDSL